MSSSGTESHCGYFLPSGCDTTNMERGRQSKTMTSSGDDLRRENRSCADMDKMEEEGDCESGEEEEE